MPTAPAARLSVMLVLEDVIRGWRLPLLALCLSDVLSSPAPRSGGFSATQATASAAALRVGGQMASVSRENRTQKAGVRRSVLLFFVL